MTVMEINEIKAVILQYVVAITKFQGDWNWDSDDLQTIGLDSLKTISLIVEIEERFDIMFDDKELLFENFSSLNKITEITLKKLNKLS
ncbi:hypothetical protein GC096_04210 [Paenibacillus sp. LMG 31461]|uniref:Carrier domain-containing protein n=1 Tax=Paenibacillus plantarum TaxID=2654975 RepID=A0ABX1X4A9_9BACL|nr:phosphopantetheine-binding protein [Paenibacillus plantarum]NOU63247.1 hypothetical protein [Paenibacillus plantarum]